MKSESLSGIVPDIRDSISLSRLLERDVFIVGRLTGELDLQIRLDRLRCRRRFRQLSADGDQRELAATSYLKHMKIAVAVS